MTPDQRITSLERKLQTLEVAYGRHKHLGVIDSTQKLSQKVFSGHIAAAGTAVSIPTGWSVSKTATGNYLITHNLKTNDYAVAATPVYTSDRRLTAVLLTKTSTSFKVNTILTGTTDSDEQFTFIVNLFN